MDKAVKEDTPLQVSTPVQHSENAHAQTLPLPDQKSRNPCSLQREFLKQIVQELRTPLTNMKTALTLLQAANLKPTQRRRYTEVLSREWERQNALVNSLLTLTQIEEAPIELQVLPIEDIILTVVRAHQPLAQERDLELSYALSPTLPPILCVDSWLRQIITNLVHNSLEFTPKGGKIWIEAREQNKFVQIDIVDTGVGLTRTEIDKIFNYFYRVPRQDGQISTGSGLGLTIVKQLLQHCNGTITVHSQPGKGSKFSVRLLSSRDVIL